MEDMTKQMYINGAREEEDSMEDYSLQYVWLLMVTI